MTTERIIDGERNISPETAQLAGALLARDYPQFENFALLAGAVLQSDALLFSHEDTSYYWDRVFYASPTVLKVFNPEILYGDPAALSSPMTLAVSETFARQYFGNADPVGETILMVNAPFIIGAVFADPPQYQPQIRCSDLFGVACGEIGDPGKQRFLVRPAHRPGRLYLPGAA